MPLWVYYLLQKLPSNRTQCSNTVLQATGVLKGSLQVWHSPPAPAILIIMQVFTTWICIGVPTYVLVSGGDCCYWFCGLNGEYTVMQLHSWERVPIIYHPSPVTECLTRALHILGLSWAMIAYGLLSWREGFPGMFYWCLIHPWTRIHYGHKSHNPGVSLVNCRTLTGVTALLFHVLVDRSVSLVYILVWWMRLRQKWNLLDLL